MINLSKKGYRFATKAQWKFAHRTGTEPDDLKDG